jgi:hypothetical protein
LCAQMIGRQQEAIVDFTRVLQVHPKNAHAYFRRCARLSARWFRV